MDANALSPSPLPCEHPTGEARAWHGRSILARLAWLPVPAYLLAVLVLSLGPAPGRFDPPYLLPILNLAFGTAVPLLVAALAARSFLATRSLALLFMSCGMLSLGASSAWTAVVILFVHGEVDAPVQIYNIGACLGALCHLASAILASRAARDRCERPVRDVLCAAWSVVLVFLALVVAAALLDLLPEFFRPGSGPSPIRQVILTQAITMFALAALVFRILGSEFTPLFIHWHSLALGLWAVGLVGVFNLSALGSPLAWVGRSALWLGCVYMFVAVRSAEGSFRTWTIPLEQALREAQERYRRLMDLCPDAVIVHVDEQLVFANPAAARLFAAPSPRALVGVHALDLVHPDERLATAVRIRQTRDGQTVPIREHRVQRLDGLAVDVESTATGITYDGRPAVQVLMRDVTERKAQEKALRSSEERYRSLFEEMTDGFALHEVVCDESGAPCDYIFLEINPGFERLTGLERSRVLGRRLTEVVPGDDREWIQIYGEVALTGRSVRFERFSPALGRHYQIFAYCPAPRHFAVLFSDVSERLQSEREREEHLGRLKELVEELARSNQDLEQFAYVCSHDLQEPLRMVAGFMQLLQQQYEGRLDAKADEYIGFAVDGAKRMKTLINDLLTYARVGRGETSLQSADSRIALELALTNLKAGLEEAEARVTSGELPLVRCDPVNLAQLFQNLLSNAIKFRSDGPPEIRVDARKDGDAWTFSIQDNGIGIDPAFHDRIFMIFQRLHTRREFPGTGIGLALCKRIVEWHGGRLWVESAAGAGSTFYFTLPAPKG